MSHIFGENRKILSIWFKVWTLLVILSWGAIGAAVGCNWDSISEWKKIEFGKDLKKISECFWIGAFGILLFCILFDIILQSIRLKKPLKSAINNLILERDITELFRLLKKIRWGAVINYFVLFLCVFNAVMIPITRDETLKKKVVISTIITENDHKYVYLGFCSFYLISLIFSALSKRSIRKCMNLCMSTYKDQNLCFFFCNEAGASKLWIALTNIIGFLASIGGGVLLGFGCFEATKTWAGFTDVNSWKYQDKGFYVSAIAIFVFFLALVSNFFSYKIKDKKRINKAIRKELNQYDMYEVKKANRLVNTFLLLTFWAILVILAIGLLLAASDSTAQSYLFKWDNSRYMIFGLAASLFLFWIPFLICQVKMKKQFKRISELEIAYNLQLGMSNIDL